MISMIAAIGKNGELGKDNHLIWRVPRDMKFFKDTTMGKTVIMGKKTYDSLGGKLPGREMIVISSKSKIQEVLVMRGIEEVLKKYLDSKEEVFIIGGASIYKQAIDYAKTLYLTEIDEEYKEADAYFPTFNRKEWKKQLLEEGEYEKIKYKMNKYVRK